jgi:hypothetical protein
MNPPPLGEIPGETMSIARAACPKGTLTMPLREALNATHVLARVHSLCNLAGAG